MMRQVWYIRRTIPNPKAGRQAHDDKYPIQAKSHHHSHVYTSVFGLFN